MTSDIVERLRDLDYRFTNAVCNELRTEAADEIESLRSRLEGMEGLYVQACEQRDDADALLLKCRGEIDYQDKLLGQLVPAPEGEVNKALWKADHPALAYIDAHLSREQP